MKKIKIAIAILLALAAIAFYCFTSTLEPGEKIILFEMSF